MKVGWYKVIIMLLVVLNASLMYQNWRLKTTTEIHIVEPSEYVGELTIPDLRVADTAGRSVSLAELAAGQPNCFFVFYSPSDCPSCFNEKTFWTEIAERTEIPVIGVASNASSTELWAWNRNNQIPIVTYVDTTFAVHDSMRFKVMPLKLLVNSYGKILWADPARIEPKEQRAFWGDLTYVMRRDEE